MIKQGLPNVKKHKVVVLSITYNHAKYIEETLKGFAMQQTAFPFLCCVFDDASTDGEQDVLKRWVENHCNSEVVEVYDHPLTTILKAPDKNNTNCIYVIHLQKINTWGKAEKDDLLNYWREQGEYIALCEGDDYWTNPLKLQKQVDFLDENPTCQMCCSDATILNDDKELNWTRYKKNCIIPVRDVVMGGGLWIQTASLLYRKELIETDYPKCHVGDYPLQIYAALSGGIYWFSEKQVVYRYQMGNSWTAKNNKKPFSEARIAAWKSEIKMLKEMDVLSDYLYHGIFFNRIATYVLNIIHDNQTHMRQLIVLFKDEVALFNRSQKLKFFLIRHRLFGVYNFLSTIKHKFNKYGKI